MLTSAHCEQFQLGKFVDHQDILQLGVLNEKNLPFFLGTSVCKTIN